MVTCAPAMLLPPPQTPQQALGSPTAVAAAVEAEGLSGPALELLKGRVMADIETKLGQKEDSLWRRGQVEIRKLQAEQQSVSCQVQKLQEQQAMLVSQNQQMQGTLLAVTSKLEMVVTEVRLVLHALPHLQTGSSGALMQHSPSPSVVSTSASEVLKDIELAPGGSPMGSTPSASVGAGGSTVDRLNASALLTPSSMRTEWPRTPHSALNSANARVAHFSKEDRSYHTPPRVSGMASTTADSASGQVNAANASAPEVLSLAARLPAVLATPQRLQLSRCLEQQCPTNVTTPSSLKVVPFTPPQSSAAPASPACRTSDRQVYKIELLKDSQVSTLGIEVNHDDEETCLVVGRIEEDGLVARHNKLYQGSLEEVRVGDRIIEVNAVVQDAKRMLQECKNQHKLCFTLARDAQSAVGANSRENLRAVPVSHGDRVEDKAVTVLLEALDEDDSPASMQDPVFSPQGKQLRPEAQVFVPSAQKEVPTPLSAPPPGLAGGYSAYDPASLLLSMASSRTAPSTLQSAAPTMALLAPQYMGIGSSQREPVLAVYEPSVPAAMPGFGDREVKKTLFP